MITKGIIKKIPNGKRIISGKTEYDNVYRVFVPVFLSPGQNENSPTCAANMDAVLCYQPGNLDSYRVGDVVFVSFENNNKSFPIIIGKLYIGEEDSTNLSNNSVLQVTQKAELPLNTKIGDITGEELAKLFRVVSNLCNVIENQQSEIETLKNIINNNN